MLEINTLDKAQVISDLLSLIPVHENSFLDACLVYCDVHKIDYESFSRLVRRNPMLMSILQAEATKKKLLKFS